MKISELVAELEALWAEHGDVNVYVQEEWAYDGHTPEPLVKHGADAKWVTV
jgi:hypothetical protein